MVQEGPEPVFENCIGQGVGEMAKECFECKDVHECSYCYLEAADIARFLGLIAGERIKALGPVG
jgi:hypothetical protein